MRAEKAALREQIRQLLVFVVENAALRAQVSQLQARVAELEGGWHKTARIAASRRQARDWSAGDRESGEQLGHAGHSLPMAERADTIVRHGSSECVHCHELLEGVAGQVIERRQVHDLPVWRVEVTSGAAQAPAFMHGVSRAPLT